MGVGLLACGPNLNHLHDWPRQIPPVVGKLTSVNVQAGGQTLSRGIPEPVLGLSGLEQLIVYDQMPDGKRFIAQVAAGGEHSTNPVTLVVDRDREVERHAR